MYKTKELKSGISLIVLVITIIVVIIIAAAVILTLTANNPISEARKATFLSDIDAFKSELDMYNTTQYATTMGNYDLSAADFSVTADENQLYTVIPSLKGKTKYRSHFEVIDGGLAYTGTSEEEITLAKDVAGIMTTNAKPEITLTTSNILPVKAGGSVAYTVTMTGTMPITIANLTGNVKVLNSAGTEVATQPSLSVGAVSGTTADKERSAVVTINTTGMAEGTYKIKLLAEAVQTAGSKNAEKVSIATFEIDNTAPAMPTITINPTTWTNGSITATITKSNAVDTLEYSTNGTTWNAYTTAITITSNLTVYARETDTASNVSNVATKVITTIDKTAPTVAFGTNGGNIPGTTVTSAVTASDTSGSGINASTLQYVWDTQNSTTPSNGWTIFTNGSTLTTTGTTGTTHYLWIKTTDIAGNAFTTKSNAFTIIGTTVYNFAYTGNYQTWTAPYTGTYRLEVWGAEGGGGVNNTTWTSKGGYAKGEITFTAGQTYYIYVGKKGGSGGASSAGWNGGGYESDGTAGGGGGATDIRNVIGNLSSRVIVAGGAGGSHEPSYGRGGPGGGLIGGEALNEGSFASSYSVYKGGPGTQSSGGAHATATTSCTDGSLGQGGTGLDGGAGRRWLLWRRRRVLWNRWRRWIFIYRIAC